MKLKLQINDKVYTFSEEESKTVLNVVMKNLQDMIDGAFADKQPVPREEKDMQYFIEILAKKWGCTIRKASRSIEGLARKSLPAAFSLMLKTIAMDLDQDYVGHISDCPKVFVVSMIDGSICTIRKSDIRNYKNFAAFRTEEDAKFAISVLEDAYKLMF